MSLAASPIHRIVPHPREPVLYLASSNRLHKYSVSLPAKESPVECTYTSPVPEAFAQYLQVSVDWVFITGGEKRIVVLDAQTLEHAGELYPSRQCWLIVGSWLLKRASALAYDADTEKIVVADKTGDVYSFPWPIPPNLVEKYANVRSCPPVDDKSPLTKATDERFMGTLLLSHSSSVTACTFVDAPWGKFLVTGDRDEHVRISCFPETWVIAAMGLGHTAFVSALAGLPGKERSPGVISGGGDKRVILWNLKGEKQAEHFIQKGSCVRFIRVFRSFVVVVGEGADDVSVVEMLSLDDLNVCRRFEVKGRVLDIAYREGHALSELVWTWMYFPVDGDEMLIREYRSTGLADDWNEVRTDEWKPLKDLENGPKVELYWLESMRKQVGAADED